MPIWISFFKEEGQFILATIPSLIILTLLPLFFRMIGLGYIKKNFDNAHPRLYLTALENEALMNDKWAKFVLRCQACHTNCIEDCILWWPAAVVSLIFSGVTYLALCLSAIHLGLRFFYIFLYCFVDNKAVSYLRSTVWAMAWTCPLIMLFECTSSIASRI